MQTAVFDVVHMFSELGISAVPIVDANGKVINLYETVDVIVSAARQWPMLWLDTNLAFKRFRPYSSLVPTRPWI
jgi:CBS-domain-containing membrane protein